MRRIASQAAYTTSHTTWQRHHTLGLTIWRAQSTTSATTRVRACLLAALPYTNANTLREYEGLDGDTVEEPRNQDLFKQATNLRGCTCLMTRPLTMFVERPYPD